MAGVVLGALACSSSPPPPVACGEYFDAMADLQERCQTGHWSPATRALIRSAFVNFCVQTVADISSGVTAHGLDKCSQIASSYDCRPISRSYPGSPFGPFTI